MKNRFFVPCVVLSSLSLAACRVGHKTADGLDDDDPILITSPKHPHNLCAPVLKEHTDTISLSYNSCDDIRSDLNDVWNYNNCVGAEWAKIAQANPESVKARKQFSPMKSADSPLPSPSGKGDLLTNLREAGVDEADVVKISADQIFVASSAKTIQVIERSGKKMTGTLNLPEVETSGRYTVRPFRSQDYNQSSADKPKLFVTGEQLIVLKDNTVLSYKISAGQLPVLRQSKSLDGRIAEARLLGERLVVVTSDFQDWSEQRTFGRKVINCASVMKPVSKKDLGTHTVTRLASLSTKDLSDFVETTHPGDFSLYMTPKNIYLYGSLLSSEFGSGTGESASIRKVALEPSGRMKDAVNGKAKGRIKDVWALSELAGGELAVASSTGELWNDTALNHFEILADRDNRLEKIGETETFGAKEDIRSVRFVGNIAYVVTFKKTDPLYAIDVSKPSDPRILGELKIPGFSTYMHPLSSERLIGLGFDATDQGDFAYYQGLQVSLFDTRDPMNMLRKDVRIVGVRGTSSAATSDHKAFYIDPAEDVFGFPISELNECQDNYACRPSPSALRQMALGRGSFSGAVFYKISGDMLGEEKRVTHSNLMSESCKKMSLPTSSWWQNSQLTSDIQRIFKLAGEIVTISQGALKTFRISGDLEETGSARWSSDCD